MRADHATFRDHADRPAVSCCRPEWEPWPSGHAWTHQRTCPRRPREKVEQRDVDRTVAIIEHPAGTLGTRHLLPSQIRAAARWHPFDCECEACEYMWEHADDDDDLGPEEA